MSTFDPCPFCGNTPSYKNPEWKDDNRYVQAELECCITMTAAIGWKTARDMSPAQHNAELWDRLKTQWNTRHHPED